MTKAKKRTLIISDLHCGHKVGLCPSDWYVNKKDKFFKSRVALWNEYCKMVDDLKPIDILVVNGDAIEGKGHRSGSTELLTVDPKEQSDLAAACIMKCEAKKILMTYGTAYHVGVETDYENMVADAVAAEAIKSQLFLNVDGTIFDIKHHVGGTSMPYGKGTRIEKERIINLLWHEYDTQPKANVLIRSHLHGFHHAGNSKFLGIVTPALQGLGSKFGARRCSNIVDFGVIWFDTDEDGYQWGYKLANVSEQKEKAFQL